MTSTWDATPASIASTATAAGSRPVAPPMNAAPGPVSPHAQLVDRAGAKGVTGCDQHALALSAQAGRQLANERGFPSPVDPDHKHHCRWLRCGEQDGVALACAQRRLDTSTQCFQEFCLRANRAFARLAIHIGDEPSRGRYTEVRLEQHFFEFFERPFADAPAHDHPDIREREVLDALPQRSPRRVRRSMKERRHVSAIRCVCVGAIRRTAGRRAGRRSRGARADAVWGLRA